MERWTSSVGKISDARSLNSIPSTPPLFDHTHETAKQTALHWQTITREVCTRDVSLKNHLGKKTRPRVSRAHTRTVPCWRSPVWRATVQ